MMKRTAAVILAGLISCIFAACGSPPNADLGLYIGTIVSIADKEEQMSDIYSGVNSIELKEGENAVFTVEDNPMECTYSIKNGEIELIHDGLSAKGTVSDGVITITDFFGMSIRMVFEKE